MSAPSLAPSALVGAVRLPRPPRVPRIPARPTPSCRELPALRPAPLDVLVLDWHLARLVGGEGDAS